MKPLSLTLLTPFNGRLSDLILVIRENLVHLGVSDRWVIILDNLEAKNCELYSDYRIIYLFYNGKRGAGCARNFGLKFIEENVGFPMLLMPLDGDDFLVAGAIELIKNKFNQTSDNMISFGHIKKWPNRQLLISYRGIFTIEELLKKYITPCGSTVIRINNKQILGKLRFSERIRTNDNLFFMQAAKYFGSFRCITSPVLIYNVGNPHSVSGKKYKQIFYKYLAFRDFGLGRVHSIYLLLFYVIIGIRRHILKQSV